MLAPPEDTSEKRPERTWSSHTRRPWTTVRYNPRPGARKQTCAWDHKLPVHRGLDIKMLLLLSFISNIPSPRANLSFSRTKIQHTWVSCPLDTIPTSLHHPNTIPKCPRALPPRLPSTRAATRASPSPPSSSNTLDFHLLTRAHDDPPQLHRPGTAARGGSATPGGEIATLHGRQR